VGKAKNSKQPAMRKEFIFMMDALCYKEIQCWRSGNNHRGIFACEGESHFGNACKQMKKLQNTFEYYVKVWQPPLVP
jgi:hypothetical protein